jgi:hypothetical protein
MLSRYAGELRFEGMYDHRAPLRIYFGSPSVKWCHRSILATTVEQKRACDFFRTKGQLRYFLLSK